jgi:hypothetical protein
LHTQPKANTFKDVQYQFTGYLRDPENNDKPAGIEQRRLNVYRDLFYNNIEGFISSCFPVLKSLVPEESWHAMVRDFMIKHKSKSPLFNEIAHEFLYYLDNERNLRNDPVFIQALCHYEWVELALSISEAEPKTISFDPEQDYLAIGLNTSTLAWPLSYTFPVHQISTDFQPEQASENPVFLLVYRDPNDDVLFLELNPVSARLIDLLNEGQTGQQAAEQIAQELQHPNPEVVYDGAKVLIHDWIQRSILISV